MKRNGSEGARLGRARAAAVLAGGCVGAVMLACQSTAPASELPAESALGTRRAVASFSPDRAWRHLKALASMGPRVSGTRGELRARAYLREQLESIGAEVYEQTTVVEAGPTGLRQDIAHVIGVLPGESPDVIMLAAHYDTAEIDSIEFLGVNDGASGPALLLELGRVLSAGPLPYTIWLTFVGGDALPAVAAMDAEPVPGPAYLGSRALADALAEDGRLDRVRLAVFFNQVCDRDLGVARDLRSHRIHREVFWEAAADLDRTEAFDGSLPLEAPVAGHLQFVEAGMSRVVAIVDDRFGGDAPPGLYWHTEQDSLDNCSVVSLAVVGQVSAEALQRIIARLDKIDRFVHSPTQRPAAVPPGWREELRGAPGPAHRATP